MEMTIEKMCKECCEIKPIGEFFLSPFDGRAHTVKSSVFCKQCHSDGRIENGYGDPKFGGMFDSPEAATA